MALNSKITTNKFSTVERSMNRYLIAFLLLLLLEVSICTGLKYAVLKFTTSAWYIPYESLTVKDAIQHFLSFLVIFNYIIPISMYVTLELQKFSGSMFFAWDEELYDKATNTRARCNTSDLNEELGQVEYLFTDKTGTLTENNMVFRQCSINGNMYMEWLDNLCEMPATPHSPPLPVSVITPEMEQFILVLTLCHTVQVNKQEIDNFVDTRSLTSIAYEPMPEFQGSSPDEKAIVEACFRLGAKFQGMVDDKYNIMMFGQLKTFHLLHLLEFDSNRKSMSVIVQNEDGEVYLMCKGAESSIVPNCTTGAIKETMEHVDDYGLTGLRTLVVANKKLTLNEYVSFCKELDAARNSLEERDRKVSQVFALVEKGLCLLGAVGVEDRLQDGVPETLESLRIAGIKIWMLTGDKMETAVNISYSCGHFKRSMIQLKLIKVSNNKQCMDELGNHRRVIATDPLQSYGLIVDGMSLCYALNQECVALFREVGMLCTSVVCSRLSPLQKSEVVHVIKTTITNPITAAIGDGANDCSMIQEAHVGLGIIGKEGRQAMRCSDFAFARFRFLRKILLVHGHFYYVRVSTLVQYFFYKNIAFNTEQVYFMFYTTFSSQPLYSAIFLTLFNICFTSLPIFIYGLFEQNYKPEILINNPQLYRLNARNSRLSLCNFITWNIFGIWHSLVFFFGVMMYFRDHHLDDTGQMFGLTEFGTLVFHLCVVTINLKLVLETRYITWIFASSIIVSIFGFMVFSIVLCAYNWVYLDSSFAMYWVYLRLLGTASAWLVCFLLIVAALLPDVFWSTIMNHSGHLRKLWRWVKNPKRNRATEYRYPVTDHVPSELTPLNQKRMAAANGSECSAQTCPQNGGNHDIPKQDTNVHVCAI